MTRGTAGQYWADTAEGQFDSMRSTFQPGERAEAEPAPRSTRQTLPPLTASQTILDAIAACTQPREVSDRTEPVAGRPDVPVTAG